MSPRVETQYGAVLGSSRVTDDGKSYSAFTAIPYAKPAVGELRLRDPEPLEPWKDDFDATRAPPKPFQVERFDLDDPDWLTDPKVTGSEDCLTLDVFSPDLQGALPVLVWIYGGAFVASYGSGTLYGPDYLVERDVVVVRVNYRVGIFGFLSFEDPEVGVPGNAGLKDQSVALRWVQENISAFGGDPRNVTVAGESAGSCSVHYHLVSPMSRGLFQRAILQSGTAFIPGTYFDEDERLERKLAEKLGWDGTGGDKGAYEVIARTDSKTLALTGAALETDLERILFAPGAKMPCSPRVEAYEGRLCFLPKSPLELGRDAWSKDLDILIGNTKDEGLIVFRGLKLYASALERNGKLLIPYPLRRSMNQVQQAAAASALREIYFGNGELRFESEDKLVDVLSDLFFWHPTHRFLHQRSSSRVGGRTFLYLLATSIDPDLEVYRMLRRYLRVEHDRGTNHTEEIPLIWKSVFSPKPKPGNRIFPVFEKFFEAYVSFVKAGDPNNSKLGTQWEELNELPEAGFRCFQFDDSKAESVDFPLAERMRKWDAIYKPEELK